MKSAVVHVEIGTDRRVDIGREQFKLGEMLKGVFFRFARAARRTGERRGHAGINQNALVMGGYDQVGRQEAKTVSMLRSWRNRDGSGGPLHVVTFVQ